MIVNYMVNQMCNKLQKSEHGCNGNIKQLDGSTDSHCGKVFEKIRKEQKFVSIGAQQEN